MLLVFGLRSLRRNVSQYLLAAGSVCVAAFLVMSALAGIAILRRVGLDPMREFIGGDIMIAYGDIGSSVGSSGMHMDLSQAKLFDPQEIAAQLAQERLAYSYSLMVPAYLFGSQPGQALLIGRSLEDGVPHAPIDDGRFLVEGDATSPVMVGRASLRYGGVGSDVHLRVGTYNQEAGIFDLAQGKDLTLMVLGLSRRAVGTDALTVPLGLLQSTTGCSMVSWVGVNVVDYTLLGSTAERLRALWPESTVITSEELLQSMDTEGSKLQEAAFPIMILVLCVGCISLLNTCLLMARLRRREAALLKVLGLGPAQVATTFLVEATATTLLGAGVGYLLGAFVGSGMGRFGLGASWFSFLYVLGAALATVMIAAVPPALWLARRSALEVVRNA